MARYAVSGVRPFFGNFDENPLCLLSCAIAPSRAYRKKSQIGLILVSKSGDSNGDGEARAATGHTTMVKLVCGGGGIEKEAVHVVDTGEGFDEGRAE